MDKDEALTESDEYFSTKLMYEGRSRGCRCLKYDSVPHRGAPLPAQSGVLGESVVERQVLIDRFPCNLGSWVLRFITLDAFLVRIYLAVSGLM